MVIRILQEARLHIIMIIHRVQMEEITQNQNHLPKIHVQSVMEQENVQCVLGEV